MDISYNLVYFLSLLVCIVYSIGANTKDICNRDPPTTQASKTPGDNGFRIKIAGKPPPEKYTPGQVYTITINGTYPKQKLQGFMLVAVPRFSRDEAETMGTFQHMSQGLTKFAEQCPHVVTHTYHHHKAGVEVLWTAPDKGAGCVEFRATVIEYDDIWYKDDGALTKFFCEETGTTEDHISPDMIPDCCACDTAKYMMEFEGIWSRQTHPKDFPRVKQLLHWSNIIGASHSKNYMAWQYGGMATRGVKEVCEFGYPRTLEQEMKEYSRDIRTVIRTSGIWVNLKQSRWAHFSVNQKHHLFSMLTMAGPSPDWCVGVSALNLCLPNCSWAGDMTIELLPWDAGTDDGNSYMSPNHRSDPQQKIHRITNTFPSSPNSPFFSPEPIRPLALIKLKRMHPKPGATPKCNNNSDYISLHDAEKLTSGRIKGKCATTPWDDWSGCSTTCGVGTQTRRRRFLRRGTRTKSCPHTPLMESERCLGVENTCPEGPDSDACKVTNWSEWSPCSVSCGKGTQERRRAYYKLDDAETCRNSLAEKQDCTGDLEDCSKAPEKNFTAICSLKQDIGNCRGSFERFYFDLGLSRCMRFSYTGCHGNNNRFLTLEDCKQVCEEHMNKGIPQRISRGKLEIVSPKGFLHNVHIGKGSGSHTFTIHCRTNDLDADLQWQYNGGILPPNSDKYSNARESTQNYQHSRLTVSKVTGNDMGFYTCRNMKDLDQSAQIKIMIVSQVGDGSPLASVEIFNPRPPTYTVHVRGGKQSTYFILECRTKDLDAELIWKFNGRTIEYTPKKYALGRKNDGRYVIQSVAVMRVSASDMGPYTCVNREKPSNQDSIQVIVVGHGLSLTSTANPFYAIGTTEGGPMDCNVSGWSDWTTCSATCGRGYKFRERKILQEAQNGGKKCPRKLKRKKRCRIAKCHNDENRSRDPVDCELSEWGGWTKCAKTCGDTIQERTRRVIKRPRRGGKACPPRLERRYCSLPRCPVKGQNSAAENEEN